MAITDKRLCKGTLSNSNATLYTAPAATTVIIKAMTLCNYSSTAATVTIKFDGTEVIATHSIAAYDTITIPFIDQILEAEELIEGSASAATSVNYYISGKEVTA